MTIEKKLYSATDARAVTLFSKRVEDEELVYPILVDANGRALTSGLITDGTEVADVVTNVDDDTNIDGTNGLVTAAGLYARISGSLFKPLRMDASTHALEITDYVHHEIHSGSHYYNESFVDTPSNDVVDVRFTVPDNTKWLHMLIILKTQEEYLITFYENAPIINGGTSLTAFNSNRNSVNTSGITGFDYIVNTSVANANADTDISSATAIRGPYRMGSNQGNIDGENRNDNELILKQNTSYALRCENLINSTRYVTWLLDWYEHTDKD